MNVEGWVCWENPNGTYAIGVDDQVKHVGQQTGFVRCDNPTQGQFGAIMQKFNSDEYRGKRMRFSGFLKCKDVEQRCGFFMEVYDNDDVCAIDNMWDRAISGNSDWVKCELVLDVVEKSLGLNIGARLIGPGQLWIDGLSFDEVGLDVPTTDEKNQKKKRPRNLNFR